MDDHLLLQQFALTGSGGAFEELTRRHGSYVRSVSYRILGSAHDAEEVAQECFLELAQQAENIHSSVPGWLHRAAISRSLNLLRSRGRRVRRERQASTGVESAWPIQDVTRQELQGVISGALTELPDDLRLPMMLHYFDGRSQRDVARELGLNQSTISRRMHEALMHLREKLRRAGYASTAPAIMIFTPDRVGATETGWARLTGAALAGKSTGSATLMGTIKCAAVSLVPLLTFLLFGGWISLGLGLLLLISVTRYRASWWNELTASLESPASNEADTRIFARGASWLVPSGWRGDLFRTLGWSSLFLVVAVLFAFQNPVPWGTVLMGLGVAAILFVHSFRILFRVLRFGCASNPAVVSDPMPLGSDTIPFSSSSSEQSGVTSSRERNSPSFLESIQRLAIGLMGFGVTIQAVLERQQNPLWPAVLLIALVSVRFVFASVRWGYEKLRHREITIRSQGLLTSTIGEVAGTPLSYSRFQLPINLTPLAPKGTRRFLAMGVAIVAGLSLWIVVNPATVSRLSLSLAATQTLMLGWMFSRLVAFGGPARFGRVGRWAVAILLSCFLLNSGVCLANWFQ